MNHIDNFKTFEGNFWDKLKGESKEDKMLRKANIEIKRHLSKYLLKKFPFQYAVYIWKSNSENYEEIDVSDFEFIDIMAQPYYGKPPGVFFYLIFVDKDGEKIAVDFNQKSPTERLGNLEYLKPWEKSKMALKGNYMEQPDWGKEDFDNPDNYPHKNSWIDLVPADYKTVSFLKEVKSILEIVNDQVK
jgi:hypothetical protein